MSKLQKNSATWRWPIVNVKVLGLYLSATKLNSLSFLLIDMRTNLFNDKADSLRKVGWSNQLPILITVP